MSWDWTERTDKHGKKYWEGIHPDGMECYIHRSRFNKPLTSTTFWPTGKRRAGDRFLRDEQFTSFEEAKRWIEARNPWDIYENECKIPVNPEGYSDPDKPAGGGQRGFF